MQYMPQPWRGPTDVTLVTSQISNNNSSMRLNNTKNSQLRSSARTLKQQPIINSPHELEVHFVPNHFFLFLIHLEFYTRN